MTEYLINSIHWLIHSLTDKINCFVCCCFFTMCCLLCAAADYVDSDKISRSDYEQLKTAMEMIQVWHHLSSSLPSLSTSSPFMFLFLCVSLFLLSFFPSFLPFFSSVHPSFLPFVVHSLFIPPITKLFFLFVFFWWGGYIEITASMGPSVSQGFVWLITSKQLNHL